MTTSQFGAHNQIKIPPESTGPAVTSLYAVSVVLNTITNGPILLRELATGSGSGYLGTVVRSDGAVSGTGTVGIIATDNSPVQLPSVGETLTFDGIITGVVVSVEELYTNQTSIVSADNPYQGQNIDNTGSAFVRFQDGNQQLDVFGLTRTSSPKVEDSFKFQYSKDHRGLSDIIVSGGSTTWLPNEAAVDLEVDGNPGSSIIRRTNIFYPYIPGMGRGGMMSLAQGDAGKTDNVRRWGFFSEESGAFFQLEGTTLSCVTRSTTTGSTIDTVVNQTEWSEDRVDGSSGVYNKSTMNIDVTKANIWSIDYQWLGSGIVRFSVYGPDGSRINVHKVENANNNVSPWCGSGSLPLSIENTNTSTTSGPTSTKLICAMVYTDGSDVEDSHEDTHTYVSPPVSLTSGSGETLIAAFDSAPTMGGKVNRIISDAISAYYGSTNELVVFRIYAGSTYSSGTFNLATPEGAMRVSLDAVVDVSGPLTLSRIASAGQGVVFENSNAEVYLNADGTASRTVTITAENLGAGTTDAIMSVTWVDRA
jgi:hypothetical protein